MTANIRNSSFDLEKEDIDPYGTEDLTKRGGGQRPIDGKISNGTLPYLKVPQKIDEWNTH